MKPITRSTIFSILFTCIAGCLLHFVYEWSGNSWITAWFSPINESTWEHLKLLFFPAMLVSILESLFLRQFYPGLLFYRFWGICAGLAAIVVLFYSYTGILGFHLLWTDIACFILGVLTAFLLSLRQTLKNPKRHTGTVAAVSGFLVLTACFVFFSFWQPAIGLFTAP